MSTKRLLIVEDDYDVAEMLLMYFTAHEYEVIHADNGPDGIELARKKFPNLILLDVMLPDMNGYEVCENLRKISLTRHIPVIFLTQKDSRADKVEGLQLGADDYIAKPFDVDELRLRVNNSIKRATQESLHERRTGLPTGPMIDDVLEKAQNQETPQQTMALEITGYQAFNDAYGFMAAEHVIAFAADVIRKQVTQHGTENDFIGIRDDHFVVLTYAADPETLLNHIIAAFGDGARAFYTFADAEQGGILQKDGTESETLVPIMSLSLLRTASNP